MPVQCKSVSTYWQCNTRKQQIRVLPTTALTNCFLQTVANTAKTREKSQPKFKKESKPLNSNPN